MKRTIWYKIWKNKQGQIVIWQMPNLPLAVWFIATLLTKVLPVGDLAYLAKAVAPGALFVWAVMELFSGVNYFRRGLGMMVLILTIINVLSK